MHTTTLKRPRDYRLREYTEKPLRKADIMSIGAKHEYRTICNGDEERRDTDKPAASQLNTVKKKRRRRRRR